MKKTERTPQTQTTSTSNQSSFPNAGPIPNFSKHQAFAPALPRLTASTIPVPKYEEFYELTEAAKREKENNRKYLMSVSDGRLMQLKALYSSNRWFKDSKATQMQRQWQKDDAKKYTFSANVISGADYEGYGKLINGQTITNRYEKNPKTSKKLLENKIKTYYNHFISEDQQEKDTVIHRNVAYTGDINQPANAMDFSYNKLTPTICYPAELAKRREALKDIFMSRKLVYEALVAGKENITGLTLDDAQDAYMRALRDLLKLADTAQALKKQLEGSKQGIIDEWKKANPPAQAPAPQPVPQNQNDPTAGSAASTGGIASLPNTASLSPAVSIAGEHDWLKDLYEKAQASLDAELKAIGEIFISAGIYTPEEHNVTKSAIEKLEKETSDQITLQENAKNEAEANKRNATSAANQILRKINDPNWKPKSGGRQFQNNDNQVFLVTFLTTKLQELKQAPVPLYEEITFLKKSKRKDTEKKTALTQSYSPKGADSVAIDDAAQISQLDMDASQRQIEIDGKTKIYNNLKTSYERLETVLKYLNGESVELAKEDLLTLVSYLGAHANALTGFISNTEKNIEKLNETKNTTLQNLKNAWGDKHLVAINNAHHRLQELETQAENKRKDAYITAHKAEYDKLLVDKRFLAFIILVAQLQKQARSGQPAQKPAAGQSSQELLKLKEAELLNKTLSQESLRQMTTMFNDMTTQAQMNAAAIPDGLAPDKALEMMNMNLKVNDVMAAFTKTFSTAMPVYNAAMAFAAKNLITVKRNRQERLKQYEALGIENHWAISKHLHGLDPVQAFRSLGAGFGLVESVASTTTSAAKGLGIFGAEQINFMFSLIPGINAITGAFNSIASGIDWYRSYKKMKAADNEIIVRLDRIKEREANNENLAVRLLIDGKETADKKEKKDNPSIDELKKRIGETETTKDNKTRIKTETSILRTRVNELLNNKEALSSASVKELNEILLFYNLRQIHNAKRHASKFGTISSVASSLAGGMQAALAVSLFLNPATALTTLALGGLLIPVSVGLSVANSFVQQNAIHKMEQLSDASAKFEANLGSAIKDIAALKPLSELKDNNQKSLSLDKIADTFTVADLSDELKSLNDNDKNLLFREYVPVYRKLSAIPVSIKGVDMDVDIIALAANGRPKKDEIK